MNKPLISVVAGFIVVAIGSAQTQGQAPKQGATVKATGTLQPETVADVANAVRGKIRKLHAGGEWGASVKKGDILAEIDPDVFEADVALAKARVAEAEAGSKLAKLQQTQAEKELERAKKLLSKGAITLEDFDSFIGVAEVAKAQVDVANAKVARNKAALARAQLVLDACTIRSPIDGIVIDRRVNVGQIVGDKGSVPSLFLIANNLKTLRLWAAVNELDIARVAKGQEANIAVHAFPKASFKGRVTQTRLNATFVKDHVVYTVVIEVDNSDGRLLPYLTADVMIEVGDPR